jgi:hypothetical protein
MEKGTPAPRLRRGRARGEYRAIGTGVSICLDVSSNTRGCLRRPLPVNSLPVLMSSAPLGFAQRLNPVAQFNASVRDLPRRLSPAVVEITVTGCGVPDGTGTPGEGQRASGQVSPPRRKSWWKRPPTVRGRERLNRRYLLCNQGLGSTVRRPEVRILSPGQIFDNLNSR